MTEKFPVKEFKMSGVTAARRRRIEKAVKTVMERSPNGKVVIRRGNKIIGAQG